MSFVLKKDGQELARYTVWSPNNFGLITNVSYPHSVTQDFVWEQDDYWLGWVPDPEPVPPTPEQQMQLLVEQFTDAVQQHLDSKARSKGYDNIISACSYAAAPNPFQEESAQFVTWRGNVWAYCYQELAKVQAGTRLVPDIGVFLMELPAYE